MRRHLWTVAADPGQVLCLYCGKLIQAPTDREFPPDEECPHPTDPGLTPGERRAIDSAFARIEEMLRRKGETQ